MGINITHNDDGSITAECGGEELTFFPKTRQDPLIGRPADPPIPSGGYHRAYLYVPVGNEPGLFEPAGFAPIVKFGHSAAEFERNLRETMGRNRSSSDFAAVRVVTPPTVKVDVQSVLAAAEDILKDRSIAVYLTSAR